MRFIAKVLGNSLAILLASYAVPDIHFTGNLALLLVTGLTYSIVHTLVRPVLKFFAAPFILLTFGIATFFIQIFLLWLTVKINPSLDITSLSGYVWGTIIIGLFNLFL